VRHKSHAGRVPHPRVWHKRTRQESAGAAPFGFKGADFDFAVSHFSAGEWPRGSPRKKWLVLDPRRSIPSGHYSSGLGSAGAAPFVLKGADFDFAVWHFKLIWGHSEPVSRARNPELIPNACVAEILSVAGLIRDKPVCRTLAYGASERVKNSRVPHPSFSRVRILTL
jgi:hypothetical protein